MKINFILNNEELNVDVDPQFPALRFLREEKGLTSVKTGCGEGECGACTVILGSLDNGVLNYKNVASCLLPVGELNG
ncbi:MAG: 2Fe-2S iron-sulfur cluster binding domain-containing protein, partial [Candidatus Aminicenantes bacterium]|nr:2Fe-2S iron-sulfur cluster binding domain-containing protein [Candidatus Aminicenantes bacterium]